MTMKPLPDILFEDDHFLVVDKPPDLVVSPTDTQTVPTLADMIKQKYNIDLERAGIVHRIDKDTSGVLLVAKTQEAFEKLQTQFKERKVHKEYLALVHGKLEIAGRINAPIARNPQNREKFTVMSEGWIGAREAITDYEPSQRLEFSEERIIEFFPDFSKIQLRKLNNMHYCDYTLVKCHPLTGRTHQIRVHLKHLGFPIVADERYVGRKMYRLDHRWCDRQFLHAAKIEFEHPVTGEKMVFESPLPDDLKKALAYLAEIKLLKHG